MEYVVKVIFILVCEIGILGMLKASQSVLAFQAIVIYQIVLLIGTIKTYKVIRDKAFLVPLLDLLHNVLVFMY